MRRRLQSIDSVAILFDPRARCYSCNEPITGKCISALDQKWHIDHFTCANCNRNLVGGNFVKHEDRPYCKLCPTDKVKVKKLEEATDICETCKKAIPSHPLIFKGKKYRVC